MNFDWDNPPWHGGVTKYRLGLRPVPLADWFQRPISAELLVHKKHLLDSRYHDVVQVVPGFERAQALLAEHVEFQIAEAFQEASYPDVIAHLSLQVADDLCLIESQGQQRLLAASVCSPSYWNVRDKIGQSLASIHESVGTLEEKIGDKIARSISQAPLLKPFERENWFIHGDQNRFHLEAEAKLDSDPATWFVRSERETICRFAEEYALFTINVRFASLNEIHRYPVARSDLLKSLCSLDRNETEYFGGSEKVQQLSQFLAGAET